MSTKLICIEINNSNNFLFIIYEISIDILKITYDIVLQHCMCAHLLLVACFTNNANIWQQLIP